MNPAEWPPIRAPDLKYAQRQKNQRRADNENSRDNPANI
jgi:hypothetical protein